MTKIFCWQFVVEFLKFFNVSWFKSFHEILAIHHKIGECFHKKCFNFNAFQEENKISFLPSRETWFFSSTNNFLTICLQSNLLQSVIISLRKQNLHEFTRNKVQIGSEEEEGKKHPLSNYLLTWVLKAGGWEGHDCKYLWTKKIIMMRCYEINSMLCDCL